MKDFFKNLVKPTDKPNYPHFYLYILIYFSGLVSYMFFFDNSESSYEVTYILFMFMSLVGIFIYVMLYTSMKTHRSERKQLIETIINRSLNKEVYPGFEVYYCVHDCWHLDALHLDFTPEQIIVSRDKEVLELGANFFEINGKSVKFLFHLKQGYQITLVKPKENVIQFKPKKAETKSKRI